MGKWAVNPLLTVWAQTLLCFILSQDPVYALCLLNDLLTSGSSATDRVPPQYHKRTVVIYSARVVNLVTAVMP